MHTVLFRTLRIHLLRLRQIGTRQFEWLRLPTPGGQSQVFNHKPGSDASRFKNHRKSASRVGSSTDQIDTFQVLKPIMWPEVKHLRKVMGQIERSAEVDLETLVPLLWGNHVFQSNPTLHVFDPDLAQTRQ